jgi:hypothetical protein
MQRGEGRCGGGKETHKDEVKARFGRFTKEVETICTVGVLFKAVFSDGVGR